MNSVIHIALMLVLPPLLPGIINKVKAWFAGRNGPPLFQPYYDLARLMRKGMVFSTTTTWIFRAGPVVTFASIFAAGLLVPLGGLDAPIRFTGDFIFFVYVLGLARFFTTAAALDTGSSFEGMGASREVTFAVFTEPAFLLALMVLTRISGSLSLNTMLHDASLGVTTTGVAPLILVALGLFVILLAETSRIPVDDPNTHLELTMIHEVMVLDHSGPLFGLIQYAAAMKLFVFGAVLLNVVAPFRAGSAMGEISLVVAEMAVLAAAVGLVESVMARLRMCNVPRLLVGAMLCCGFGFLLLARFSG